MDQRSFGVRKVSLVSIFSGLLVLLSGAGSHRHPGSAYIVPFRIEAYLPITAENISAAAGTVCQTDKSGLAEELILSAETTAQVFDGYRVRARIDGDGTTIYVDQDGVFVHDYRRYLLSESAILRILGHYGCPK